MLAVVFALMCLVSGAARIVYAYTGYCFFAGAVIKFRPPGISLGYSLIQVPAGLAMIVSLQAIDLRNSQRFDAAPKNTRLQQVLSHALTIDVTASEFADLFSWETAGT